MLINGRYKVIRTLGEGGFGHAYLSEDTQMPSKRQCVVKQLKPISAGEEIYQVVQQRFEREATMLEKLGEHHSQIPQLYAYFSENQHFYLVQEWIEGETLDAVVERGILSEERVVSILTSLLKVLDFIHARGVIHRDIKPDNVILRAQTQQPVLIDFGAMRETMGTVFNSRNHPTSSIVIGTPGYMASEQAAGRPIPSSDLYSLGLMAIYMLTGKTPQELPSDPRSGELVWQDLVAHVSPQLVATIAKTVQSHPRDRYSSAQEMLSALSGSTAAFDSTAFDPSASAASSPHTVPPANELSTGLSTGPSTSEVRTVAVAGSSPSLVQNQTDLAAARSQSASSEVAASQVSSGKSFSPWLLGGAAALLGAIAVGGGIAFSRLSGDSAVRSASVSVESKRDIDSETEGENKRTLSAQVEYESERESDVEATTPPVAQPPVDDSKRVPDDTVVTLASQGADRIDVYEQPSVSSNSPHYGVPGDRVLSTAKLSNASGDWNFVRFESGAEGWVPARFITMAPPSEVQPPEVQPPKEPLPAYAQLAGSAPGRSIWVFAEPSAQSDTPHYGLSGDRVALLDRVNGDDGLTWYQVEFESGAVGWVPSDFMYFP